MTEEDDDEIEKRELKGEFVLDMNTTPYLKIPPTTKMLLSDKYDVNLRHLKSPSAKMWEDDDFIYLMFLFDKKDLELEKKL